MSLVMMTMSGDFRPNFNVLAVVEAVASTRECEFPRELTLHWGWKIRFYTFDTFNLTWVLPGDLFCGAEEEPLESFLEVLVEGDVDDGVDHGVGVGEHVDPEGVCGELMIGGEDRVSHEQLLGRPAKEEGCYHHEDQLENLLWTNRWQFVWFNLSSIWSSNTSRKPFSLRGPGEPERLSSLRALKRNLWSQIRFVFNYSFKYKRNLWLLLYYIHI